MANVVEIVLKLKDKATSKLGKALGGLKKRFSALGTAIKVGAVAALAAFTAMIYKFIKAAGAQEVIVAKLQKAVENAGQSWAKAKPKLIAFAAEMQKLTVYGDTQTYKLIQELIPYTNDYTKAMEASKLAMDLAAAGLFDISAATKYVGMAYSGNVEMLGRYVAELRAATNPQLKLMSAVEKTAYAFGLLQQKYGGMAEKELGTFPGRIKQLANYIGDVAEAIGEGLLPTLKDMAEHISNKLPIMEKEFKRLSTIIGQTVQSLVTLGGEPIGRIIKAFSNLLVWIMRVSKGILGIRIALQQVVKTVGWSINLQLKYWRKYFEVLSKIPIAGKMYVGIFNVLNEAVKETTKYIHFNNVAIDDWTKQINILSQAQEDIINGVDRTKESVEELTEEEKKAAAAVAALAQATKNATAASDATVTATKNETAALKEKEKALEGVAAAINRAFIEQEAREAAKAQGLSGKIYRDEQGDIRMEGTPSPMSMSQRMSVFSAYGEAFWDVVIGKLPPMYAVATDINIARKAHAAWVAGKDMPAGVTLKFEGGAPPTSEMVRQDPEKWQDYIRFQVAKWGEGYAKTLWGDLAKEIGAEIGIVLGKNKIQSFVEQAKQQTTQNININLPNAIAADGKTLKSAAGIIGEEIGRQVSRGQLKGW